mgnify:CR=1 FL=1
MFSKLKKLKHGYNLRSSIFKNPLKKIIRKRHRYGQRKFRDKLIKKYDSKCALLGIHSSLCDAAHILPYSDCENSNDKYDVNNGILLSATLHKAYDRNYFWIDENSCQIKINYSALAKDEIDDLKAVGLNGFEDFYVPELDNKYGKEYLRKRNEIIRK